MQDCFHNSPLRLKKVLFSVLCLLLFIPLQASIKITVSEGWKFCLGDKQDNRLWKCDDSKWALVNLPHTWNSKDAADDEPGYYRGIGWYRKLLYIDSTVKDKVTSLFFDGANQITELYVNEKLVGTHKGGYTRFCFDISRYILPGSNNLITIKVDNSHHAALPPLSADFTFFGGIYRNIYLQVKEKAGLCGNDFASDGVYIKTRSVNDKQAIIQVQSLIDNSSDEKRTVRIQQSIIAPGGKKIRAVEQQLELPPNSCKTIFNREFTIELPLLWSPETPQLYLLRTTIIDAVTKKELDNQLNTFGLRWFGFDAEKGFSLNGRHIKLIGTNRHQCYLNKGNALPDELHIEDIRLLKEMGGNMLRISHYPQDPLILEMCDKLGIITSVEVPVVNEITESEDFLQNTLTMATEMVKQNFNHPSVVIWAYMNEVMLRPPFVNDSVRHAKYCEEVHRQATTIDGLLRKLDADRYTMIPCHGSLKRYEEASLLTVPMIIGWNLYQGWYGGRFAEFDSFLANYHTKYPRIPILVTEYGADVDDRLHCFKPERFDFTVEYADLYHEHYLETILRNDYIAGATIWNLNDFYSEARTDAVPHVNMKGITTQNRQLKNTYLLYMVNMLKEPMAYIGSRSWKNRAGIDKGDRTCLQPVKLYTNQPGVDVYHNGIFYKRVEAPRHYAELELPFTNGRNSIELRIGNTTYDFLELNFNLLPANIQQHGVNELNVMLGSNRYFEDREAGIVWMPEQPYTPGSWGYIGGNVVRPKTKAGTLPSTSVNIMLTENDPIFQTQRKELQSFKADVQDGQYAVYLYWANLAVNAAGKLIYNLGNNAVNDGKMQSVMNVRINSQPVISHFNLNEMNTSNAIVKKVLVDVVDKKGITVNLEAVEGKTVLNAIRIVKLN